MRSLLRIGLASAPLLAAVVAQAQQVQFAGLTRADTQLIHDIMEMVATIGRGSYHCAAPDRVEASPAPSDFTMTNARALAGTAPLTYERWDVSLCGTVVPFSIAYWPDPDGSFLFLVTEWPKNATEANAPPKAASIDDTLPGSESNVSDGKPPH
jgi:hypothetical protein